MKMQKCDWKMEFQSSNVEIVFNKDKQESKYNESYAS